jgi:hypothetical protein
LRQLDEASRSVDEVLVHAAFPSHFGNRGVGYICVHGAAPEAGWICAYREEGLAVLTGAQKSKNLEPN